MKIQGLRISIISFTDKGDALNRRVADILSENEVASSLKSQRTKSLQQWTKEAFRNSDAIIFIGAVGIAVRAIAPYIKSKDKDPAVIVCDELGKYTISLLSGHIGGANNLTSYISEMTGSLPIITTATDLNNVWAVDTWAKEKGYHIEPITNIKCISGTLLKNESVGIMSEMYEAKDEIFSKGDVDDNTFNNLKWNDTEPDSGIYISPYMKNPYKNTLHLVPKCIVVGVGSRKNANSQALIELVDKVFKEENISLFSVKEIATIDIKKDEPSVLALRDYLGVPLVCYSAEELNEVQGSFTSSDFVKNVTGTDNVCERSAVKSSENGRLICPKTKGNAVTVALAVTNRNED